jgi:hypothetical protein
MMLQLETIVVESIYVVCNADFYWYKAVWFVWRCLKLCCAESVVRDEIDVSLPFIHLLLMQNLA